MNSRCMLHLHIYSGLCTSMSRAKKLENTNFEISLTLFRLVIPAPRRLRREDLEFKSTVDCITRIYLKSYLVIKFGMKLACVVK